MRLVDDWKQWHRWWSMRWIIASVFLGAVAASYALLPDDWLPAVPQWIKGALALATVLTAGCAAVGRVMDQPPKDPPA